MLYQCVYLPFVELAQSLQRQQLVLTGYLLILDWKKVTPLFPGKELLSF